MEYNQNVRNIGMERSQIDTWKRRYDSLYRIVPSALSEEYAEFDAYVSHIEKLAKRKLPKNNFFSVTINPDYENTSFDSFRYRVRKFIQRKFIKSYKYVYEIGDTNDNYHVHMLIETCKKDGICSVQNYAYSTFKHEIGSPKHIRVDSALTPENFIEYMSKNTDRTLEFRKKHNLRDMYTSEIAEM